MLPGDCQKANLWTHLSFSSSSQNSSVRAGKLKIPGASTLKPSKLSKSTPRPLMKPRLQRIKGHVFVASLSHHDISATCLPHGITSNSMLTYTIWTSKLEMLNSYYSCCCSDNHHPPAAHRKAGDTMGWGKGAKQHCHCMILHCTPRNSERHFLHRLSSHFAIYQLAPKVLGTPSADNFLVRKAPAF